MDLPNSSDGGERSWDRPWTTEEMRMHRENWSLACDVGLFRHLEKFSEELTAKAQRTSSSLTSLVDDLKESSLMIDNVTNVSLALANTQFIESRVYEDTSLENAPANPPNAPSAEPTEADMVSAVSESIKQSLIVMDSKYERVEVLASSDSEDDLEATPSVILKPQDPYQNRPLPYVIGTEQWRSSSKIGLSSSSSESEHVESDNSDNSDTSGPPPRLYNPDYPKRAIKSHSKTSSSSSSSVSDYNEKSNTHGASSRTDKIYTRSQDTLNSTSEIETPTGISKDTYRKGPSFAEELAKRLGNVLPIQKPSDVRDSDQTSINRSKDDLFGSDNEPDSVFNSKSDSVSNGLFDEDVSRSLWKDKPAPRPPAMIPASLDVPPPINTVETKPKSAIDDLFGDNDSDDSDDIFAPNSKFMGKFEGVERIKEDNVASSTPETNNNIPNLFKDDDDGDNLFSPIENVRDRSPEAVRNISRKAGILGNQSDLLSSALGSRLFNRARNDFSDSSENESVEPEKDMGELVNVNENQSTEAGSRSESMVAGNLQRSEVNNEVTTDSSGISIQPTSVNSTFGMSQAFGEPQMESTRLLSDDIYRERIPSDSLFTRSRPLSNTQSSQYFPNSILNQAHQESLSPSTSVRQDLSSTDDIFGPPPLPKATKSKTKVNSLFDDSDSGDDLFSNTSSGSRSQKSADQSSAQFEKAKSNINTRSYLDSGSVVSSRTDIDIFGESSTGDLPRVEVGQIDRRRSDRLFDEGTKAGTAGKVIERNFFDDDDGEDLFAAKGAEDLFPSRPKMSEPTDVFPASSKTTEDPKKGAGGEKLIKKSYNPAPCDLFDDVDEGDDSLFSEDKSSRKEAPPPAENRGEGGSTTDGPAVSKHKSTGELQNTTKIDPPKSLKIKLPIPGADDALAPRRAVSGKIKNLMGKMGDLKILSPTDAPPILRKGEEKEPSGDTTPDRDSEDGGAMSAPKTPTSPLASRDLSSKEPSLSPSVIDTETAVSFDVPVQVETLSIASKSRVRIPAKRRPQSRQARQSALRNSGLEFDSVDACDTPAITYIDSPTETTPTDRLTDPLDPTAPKPLLQADDKSELSLGKESSLSITKNTLLSPSTDEEDLFDVPPDLPEDPHKEDLFGRAPILSPIPHLSKGTASEKAKEPKESLLKNSEQVKATENPKDSEKPEDTEEVSDPLRNKKHDPLNDPSQLFAFVTKTPSPDKPKDLLDDSLDDSLFSHTSTKRSGDLKTETKTFLDSESTKSDGQPALPEPKKPIDLFGDDDSEDLFSGPFTKSIGKKNVKERAGLFDDVGSDEDDLGDDLFGSVSSKKSGKSKPNVEREVSETADKEQTKDTNVLGDDEEEDDEELFFDASEKPSEVNKDESLFGASNKILKTKLEDIFGDASNGDDDIFSGSKKSESVDLFGQGKKSGDGDEGVKKGESGGSKKSVTRDLKKTAERIGDDPLSLFQDE